MARTLGSRGRTTNGNKHGDDAIVDEFIVEAREHLDICDTQIVEWESAPEDLTRLRGPLRGLHTIKGSCGWLGLQRMEALTHAVEEVVLALKDGTVPDIQIAVDATMGALGELRRGVDHVEAQRAEPEEGWEPLIKALGLLLSGALEAPSEPEVPAPDAGPVAEESVGEVPGDEAAGRSQTTIRVDVRVLDRLMNQVGELVLVRNQLAQALGDGQVANLAAAAGRLDGVTTELQESVMKTRMRPVGSMWTGFPRLVREVSRELGKDVTLHLDGGETELDRTLLEAVKDPLTHLVRNAIDHGLEGPAAREAAGKPGGGHLTIRAYHEGGQVNIQVSDDGAGLDTDAIRALAIERKLVTRERAAELGAREIHEFVFHPGFSTSEAVTAVSGRGVGMDVVRTNIERIGGTVDIQSRPGAGTTFRLKIPLTLAIIPALIVRAAGLRYAIPQASVIELVRMETEGDGGSVENVFGASVYRLRGQLLPLVYLSEVLGGTRTEGTGLEVNIAVLEAGDRTFGLVVDGVQDTEEIVVKPLGHELAHLWSFAGATIMGDGKVALILDVAGIARHANVMGEELEADAHHATEHGEGPSDVRESILVVRHGFGGRLAIALSRIARLEEFSMARIERTGGGDVIQYRGGILPLYRMAQILPERRQSPRDEDDAPRPDAEVVPVIVHRHDDRVFGIIVEDIIDIVEDTVDVTSAASRAGVLGSAIIQGQVTEVLDMDSLVERLA